MRRRHAPWGSVQSAAVSCTFPGVTACDAGGENVTLAQLSKEYEASAALLRARLRLLRQMLAEAEDPEEVWHIKRRIAELTPMLTQMNELAELTAHYYERGYYRSEKYTL